MNAEEEINAAVYCLRREYRDEIDEAMIEKVIADIRRKHREATIRAITGFLSAVGNGLYRLLTSPLALVGRQLKRS